MSAQRLPRCPICHKPVTKTIRGNIAGHFNTANRPCETSGETYQITMSVA